MATISRSRWTSCPRLGLASAGEAGGMQEDRYRSLVYFTRDIAYANGGLPEFAEFLPRRLVRRRANCPR